MESNLTTSLLITAVGMGLVFGAILVLWIGMIVLVRLAERWDRKSQPREVLQEAPPALVEADGKDKRKLAAAIGAAYALAQYKQSTVHEFPLPSMAFVTAWQAVMRSRNFSRRR